MRHLGLDAATSPPSSGDGGGDSGVAIEPEAPHVGEQQGLFLADPERSSEPSTPGSEAPRLFFPCNREDGLVLLGSLCISEFFPDAAVRLAVQADGIALVELGLRLCEEELLHAGQPERFPVLVEVRREANREAPRTVEYGHVVRLVFRTQDEADAFRFRPVDEFDTEVFECQADGACFGMEGPARFELRSADSSVAMRTGHVVDRLVAGIHCMLSLGEIRCIEVAGTSEPDLDLVVVDEVQDLQPEWVQAMLSRLRTDGRAVLLEDPGQRLYSDRVSFDVAGAVTVTSHENFRSPRALVRLINGLRLADVEVDALSAHEGELPDPIVYESAASVQSCTVQAIERCVQRGFPIDDIAVVSLKGRDRSSVQGSERLGRWSVRRFTGRFDDGGAAMWSTGDLLVESVRRFKGQSAAAIVLTECEPEDLDDMTRRLLFVGLTRARMHLEWVMSPSLASIIRKSLSA